jgi:DNA-binding transcriptional MocR family regulator
MPSNSATRRKPVANSAPAATPLNLSLNHPPLVPEVFDPEYREAINQVLARETPSEILGSHRWKGTDSDRQMGARFVARRLGAEPSYERVILTNGTQSALVMLFSGLVGPGAVLLTEDLTYPPLHTFAKQYGFRLHGVPMDKDGLLPEAFAELCRSERPQALYAMSSHQNPTTAIMPLERRQAIVDIARQHGVAIIEDDIYSLLSPDMPPPLSALAPEISWYVLGVAKSIAAGMKIAYVVAPSAQMAASRFWPGVRGTHWMSAPISAAVMSRLIENGGAARIIAAVSAETRARHELVTQHLAGIRFATKPTALHVWFELPAGMSRQRLAERCLEAGLIVGTSDQYVVGSRPVPEAVRIGIGNPKSRGELAGALRALAAVYGEPTGDRLV